MNALELIEYLESGYDTQMHEAASMLRRQHEAIKQLREALSGIATFSDDMEAIDCAVMALKDTEEFQ